MVNFAVGRWASWGASGLVLSAGIVLLIAARHARVAHAHTDNPAVLDLDDARMIKRLDERLRNAED